MLKTRILIFILSALTYNYAFAGDHHHHVAIFTGATHAHGVSYGTVGLEYEYRLTEMWGLGGLYESIQTNPSTAVTVLFGSLHIDALKFSAGFGKETINGHSESLQRLSLAYDFDVNVQALTVSPSVSYDFINGGQSAVLYGILWGLGF